MTVLWPSIGVLYTDPEVESQKCRLYCACGVICADVPRVRVMVTLAIGEGQGQGKGLG